MGVRQWRLRERFAAASADEYTRLRCRHDSSGAVLSLPKRLPYKVWGRGMTVLFIIALVVACLCSWRALDKRADNRAWQCLLRLSDADAGVFSTAMVASLPEPAQRYFTFMIAPGTPLRTIAEIQMTGHISLGSKEAPRYRPMQARQILAPPYGLVWQLRTGFLAGSDGALPDASWTRFWLFGLFPVARASGPDHHRSAFGRVVAEAAFWAPASLLPGPRVRWEPVDEHSARAIVTCGELSQAVVVTVDESGMPTRVVIQRWSNENPEKVFREQPFGGYLADFRQFDGYTLPTRVEGGNLIGTSEYFPFYKAEVTALRMHGPVLP